MKETFKSILQEIWKFGLPEIQPRNLILPLNTSKLICLSGPKRAGKTYLMFEGIKNLLKRGVEKRHIIYLSFKDGRLDCQIDECKLILEAHLELFPNAEIDQLHIFFDDIEQLDSWEYFISQLFNHVSQNIYLSTSINNLYDQVFSGRLNLQSIHLEVFPLAWNEFCHFHQLSLKDKSLQNKAKLERLFDRYLLQGGFPELNHLDPRTHRQKLSETINSLLFQNLLIHERISSISYLIFTINRLLQNQTSTLSVHKIFNDIKSQGYKCSKAIVYDIFQHLANHQLFIACLKYDKDLSKSLSAEKKFYAIDHSLLDLYDFNNTDREKKLELLIYLEIRKRTEQIWYYKNGHKTDFVGKWFGSWNAIQVCWALNDETSIHREFGNLTKTCHKLGIGHGWVVTRSTNELLTLDGIEIQVICVTNFLESHPLFTRK